MKKLILFSILIANISFAQKITGTAVYESKMSMGDASIKVQGGNPEMEKLMIEMMKKQMEKKYFLHFNNFESVFEEEEKLEQPSVGGGGMMVKMQSFGGGGSKSYKNIKEKISLYEQEVLGKEFLIKDSLQMNPWEITDETKKIGNYTCTKAFYTKKAKDITDKIESKNISKEEKTNMLDMIKPKDITVTAWFTTEIPVSNGPQKYWGLPGLILEVSDGRTIFLCSKITLNPVEEVKIEKPNKGKKVTNKEFEKIMEERMKDFQNTGGGRKGEGVQMIIRN
jgi:GLPGLI family protein